MNDCKNGAQKAMVGYSRAIGEALQLGLMHRVLVISAPWFYFEAHTMSIRVCAAFISSILCL